MKIKDEDIASFPWYGADVRYIGSPPGDRTLFITGNRNVGKRGMESIYRSALEAAWNGWNLAYIPGQRLSEVVEKAIYECDGGSLFAFSPMGLKCISSSLLSRCLVTGGGVLSIVGDEDVFSIEALNATTLVASSLSKVTLIGGENINYLPSYITSALDEGREVAILENTLNGRAMRNLHREGAPLIPSFSSLLSSPRYITYHDKHGKYGIMGERFSIMDLYGYEKR